MAQRAASLYAALVTSLLYVALRRLEFTNVPGPATDTKGYEDVARLPLWDWHFYAAQRGLTIPLFYKLVPGSEARIVVQLALSIVAWLLLAFAVAVSVRQRALRGVAFVGVLGTSLTWEVIRWDALLLSESVTLSLTALLLAATLALVETPTRGRAAAFIVAAFLWVFSRDTNTYVLLVAAVGATLTLLRPGHQRLKCAVAAACLAIVVASYASADHGHRWLQPMRDLVAHRVLPDPQMRAFFVHRGLDPNSNWPVGRWMVSDSRRVYAEWLLGHPKYTLVTPVYGYENTLWSSPYNLDALVDPNLEIYDAGADHRTLAPPHAIEHVFFPQRRGVGLLLVAALALAAAAARVGRWTVAAVVPVAVLASTYPHFLVVWLQSGIEVDRHAVEAALLLRLSIVLLGIYALDALVAGAPIMRRSRSTSDRSTRSVAAPGS